MPVRRHRRLLLCGLTLVVGLGSGCRLFNKSSGESGGGGTRDPLFGRDRIPATDLPTGRENARGKRDPLLVSPSKDDEKLSSDLPSDGRREPFRTGPNTTAAGLARGGDPLLSVRADEPADDRRPRGGPVMLKGNSETSALDRALDDLKRLGVKAGEPVREGGEYVLRGERESGDGIRRRYEASGSSPAAAAQDLLEQVRSEQNN